MADLADKADQARRQWIDAGGFGFLIQRPNEGDLARFRAKIKRDKIEGDAALVALELIKSACVGWRGVKEETLVPGGGDADAPFTERNFASLIEDRADLWPPLNAAIWEMIAERDARTEALRGN